MGHARTMQPRGASGPGKSLSTSSTGRRTNRVDPLQKRMQPERQEVRPVTRGQRPARSRCRSRGKGADARSNIAGVSVPVWREISRRKFPNRAKRPHSINSGWKQPERSRRETETSACRGEWRRGAHGPQKRERLTMCNGRSARGAPTIIWLRTSGLGVFLFLRGNETGRTVPSIGARSLAKSAEWLCGDSTSFEDDDDSVKRRENQRCSHFRGGLRASSECDSSSLAASRRQRAGRLHSLRKIRALSPRTRPPRVLSRGRSAGRGDAPGIFR